MNRLIYIRLIFYIGAIVTNTSCSATQAFENIFETEEIRILFSNDYALDSEVIISISPNYFEELIDDTIFIREDEKYLIRKIVHLLNALQPEDIDYSIMDARRKIEIKQKNEDNLVLYIDYFHVHYNGRVYMYSGLFRDVVESLIRDYKYGNRENTVNSMRTPMTNKRTATLYSGSDCKS